MVDISKLQDIFNVHYAESKDKKVYFSPGRVNLIGEHTDYNGGYVLPCALSYGTYLIAEKTNNQSVHFVSTNMVYEATVALEDIAKKHDNKWVNYPLGVINQILKRGYETDGMYMLYSGNIPNGAGLSSSASIELVTSVAIDDLFDLGIDRLEMIKLSQKAENEFVGVNCGIMDQFAVGLGKKDHAIFLNCDTLEYELIPIILEGYKLVIVNTNKQRGLADSKYNERCDECAQAVKYLSKEKPLKQLGDLNLETFKDLQTLIPDETILRRARHVISENNRVLEAVDALKNNKLSRFGELMYQSHDSLRDDYEVTGIELDTLVEEARKINGVLGSRMTGAGFGGCTVTLIADEAIDEFTEKVSENYTKKTGLSADFYIAEIGDGAKRLQ